MPVEVATAYVSLIPSFRGGVSAIEKEAGQMGAAVTNTMATHIDKETKSSGRLGKAFSGIGKAMALGVGAGLGVGIVTDVLGGFLTEATEAQKTGKLTAAALKSTGGAAHVTAQQVADLAQALSAKAGVDDELIQSGANVLLTFTKVRNEAGKGNKIFDAATSTALDMSSALGTDLQGSVIQVGKALNDPIKGITALTKVGVSFTQQQKDQIKALVESGDTLGAQKIILGELNTEFGGAAEAGATSGDKLKVAWGNVQEEIGTKLLPVFEKVATWLSENLPKAIANLERWWADHGQTVIDSFVKTGEIIRAVWDTCWEVIKGAVDMITAIIEGGIATWTAIWPVIKFFYDVIRFVWDTVYGIVTATIDTVTSAIQYGVDTWNAIWATVAAIYTFFHDNVYNPLQTAVQGIVNFVASQFFGAVAGARLAWAGITAIYTFFRDNVFNPLSTAVTALGDGIIDTFKAVVLAVGIAWDLLGAVCKAPINLVIGFYNVGIRGVWNNVIGRIPGIPDLPEVAYLASGGQVPGTGNRDSVPAMLTPGEFVITKKAAKVWGPELLALLNDPKGTIDPGIFGYAGGGPVNYRSRDDVLKFAMQQVGKPYSYTPDGVNGTECSFLWSSIVNYALGAANPFTRRFSSGTVQGDPALKPGLSDLATGLNIGRRMPYQVNQAGNFVGHVAGTVAGQNFEATPPVVRGPGSAKGATDLPDHFFLPGWGGLSAEDQRAVDAMTSLKNMKGVSGGSPPMGDLLQTLVNKLPGIIWDFFMKRLPGLIVDAITGVFTASAAGHTPPGLPSIPEVYPGSRHGGTLQQPGPRRVGEYREELVWANRDEYIQANAAAGGVGGPLIGQLVNNRRDMTPTDLAQALQIARLQMAL
jgi:hypothetical protein